MSLSFPSLRSILEKESTLMAQNPRLKSEEKKLLQKMFQSLIEKTGHLSTAERPAIEHRVNLLPPIIDIFIHTLEKGEEKCFVTAEMVTKTLQNLKEMRAQNSLHDPLPVMINEDIKNLNSLTNCLKTLAATKSKASAILLTPGSSKGFLFNIKDKNGTIRGYLFGTMHYLFTDEMKKCAQITPLVQERLSQCILLGTEISKIFKCQDSVEKTLCALSEFFGIFNVGIDAVNREELELEEKKEENAPFSTVEEGLELLNQCAKVYQTGNLAKFKQLRSESGNDSKIRNQVMSERIDALLQAQEPLKDEDGEFPKLFFAVGTQHLISVDDGTVVELLQDKGWTLNFVDQ